MVQPIEDYALIGNTYTAALIGRNGSLDWLCFPRFDSPACFAQLLGSEENGYWKIAPLGGIKRVCRRYRDNTLILETDFHTEDGAVRVTDCMPMGDWGRAGDLVRIVTGLSGRVAVRSEAAVRFDYGSIVPWVKRFPGRIEATAGPDHLELRSTVEQHGENFHTVADFSVEAGQTVPFVMTYYASHETRPVPLDAHAALATTEDYWQRWSSCCRYEGEWGGLVRRSLITLKALTFRPTGGIVAAPTTSLPEHLGGVRNWDYRYCWLRDAAYSLYALLIAGYTDEAKAWREWLLRAVAGHPADMQILYGLAGERRLTERELPWLPGYENSSPVRTGNLAANQFQLDVYGEVMDVLHVARANGLQPDDYAWEIQQVLLEFLEGNWQRPDEGIWEVRGESRHFTHSKIMAWMGMDRAVKGVERFGLPGPVDRWRGVRDQIHQEVCERGFDAERNTFVQSYDSHALDASLLLIPLVGFLPPDDPRVHGTVAAIDRELTVDGFVRRYVADHSEDGLPGEEGTFLPCTFWLADNYAMLGQRDRARDIFGKLRGIANDVGLYAEEYDPRNGRMLGNFPQAFTHVMLINTARNLSQRPTGSEDTERPGENIDGDGAGLDGH